MIPPMPRLSMLSVYDRGLYSKAEAAPINASLFARLPMLDPRDFEEWHRQTKPWMLLAINGKQPVHSGRWQSH